MSCEEALLLISGHIDQENTSEEEASLLAHLEHCSACRQVLQAFEEMNIGLAALQEEPPAALRNNVMDVIRAESAKPKKYPSRWISLVAAAAAIALMIGISAVPQRESANEAAGSPMVARSMPSDEEVVPMELSAENAADSNPEDLAEARQAAVAVTEELLPEMEICSCEALESGAVLYCLPTVDSAQNLSEQYGLELFLPETAAAEVSYALLLPPQ